MGSRPVRVGERSPTREKERDAAELLAVGGSGMAVAAGHSFFDNPPLELLPDLDDHDDDDDASRTGLASSEDEARHRRP